MKTPKRLDVLRRALHRSTTNEHGCLLYGGSVSQGRGGGYGRLSYLGQTHSVHIFAFETYHGRRVRPGMFLDHLCENRHCWNPMHLEEVRQSTNEKRKRRRRKWAPAGEADLNWLFEPEIVGNDPLTMAAILIHG